jgi:hypothetical protein
MVIGETMNLIPDSLYPSLSVQDRKDIEELLKVCRQQHKGAGGQGFCICQASCGGSPACRGLAVLSVLLYKAYDPAWRKAEHEALRAGARERDERVLRPEEIKGHTAQETLPARGQEARPEAREGRHLGRADR